MSDVEIFYAELEAAADALGVAASDLTTVAADVVGEDTGIENPAARASLRLEMHRRLTALHDQTLAHAAAGHGLGASIRQIMTQYTALDRELTGQEQP